MTIEPVENVNVRRRIDVGWLREHYPEMTTVTQLADDYADEFGWRPTDGDLYRVARNHGIRKRRVGRVERQRAERVVRWDAEPEMSAWMLEHDHGQRSDKLSDEFRQAFGFGLTRTQITTFRMRHGTVTKRGNRTSDAPVGAERYDAHTHCTYVKVAEKPTRKGSKDNWVPKAHLVWAEAHGEPFPEDHCCYHADGNGDNLDPDNLVAVPRRLTARINAMRDQWTGSAELLELSVTLCTLSMARNDLVMGMDVTCKACGAPFRIDERYRGHSSKPTHCPDCIAKGLHRCTSSRRYDHDEMIKRHGEGEAISAIARDMGCSYTLVWQIVSGRYNER